MKRLRKILSRGDLSVLAGFILLLGFVPRVARAQELADQAIGYLGTVAAWFILQMANVVSRIALGLMEVMLVPLIRYSDFIDHNVVIIGWAIVRDVVNIGIIGALLFIAFGTMFGISKTNWKQQVPRLLVAAVAVNFSRLIVGLFIDIGQVFMIAFVNAIQQVGAGNFVALTQFGNIQRLSSQGIVDPSVLIGAAVLALIMSTIIAMVVLAMVAVLAYRIVVLWVLIILSPLAFFLGATKDLFTDAGGQYAQWWKKLTAAITVGPVLLFFLWLAFASVPNTSNIASSFFTAGDRNVGGGTPLAGGNMNAEFLTGFVIAIALLLAGLEVAAQSASAMGNFAGKAVGAASKGSNWVVRAPVAGAALVGGWAGAKAAGGVKGGVKMASAGVSSVYRGKFDRTDRLKSEKKRAAELQRSSSLTDRMEGNFRMSRVKKKMGADQERFAQLRKETAGFGGDMTPAEYKEYKANMGPPESMTERQKAEMANAEESMIFNKTGFAQMQKEDPDTAKALYASVRARAESDDDEKVGGKLDKMMESRPDMSFASEAQAVAHFGGMDKSARNKIDPAAFSDPAALAGAISGGLFDEINADPKGVPPKLKGLAKLFDVDATGSRGLSPGAIREAQGRKDRVSGAQESFETERDAINTRTMSDEDRAAAHSRNENTLKYQAAAASDTLPDALKNGLRLEDTDTAATTHAQRVDDMISVVLDPASISAISSARGARDAGDLDGDRVMRAVVDAQALGRSGTLTSKEETALRATEAAASGSAASFGYAAAGFSGPNERSSYKAAVASQPDLIQSVRNDINYNGGNSDLGRATMEALDEKTLKGMLKRHDSLRGSAMEGQSAESLRQITELFRRNRSILGSAYEDQAEKTMKFIERRIEGQI